MTGSGKEMYSRVNKIPQTENLCDFVIKEAAQVYETQ